MAYEVPQELEYREKIIFGLDFEQLIYAIIFAPLALIIFFKTDFNQELKIVLVSFVVILAGGLSYLK
ncbi:MAG: PrgI family protein [Nanoarchaeota archaeon]|nr:PrgI family protein [Nanoarchaeota archaeon]